MGLKHGAHCDRPAQPSPDRPFCEVEIHAIKWTPDKCDRTSLLYSVKMHTIKWTTATGPGWNAS
ncbi:hypothetical protein J6590_025400 [Homalodisca vitripennis]|nr:hypothetical protein J6590_025400 [Homalodisca vitripennis]